MLEKVKTALRISTNAFDRELENLIEDAKQEIFGLGVYNKNPYDRQIETAVIFYCKSRFGDNPESEKWERLYRDKIVKLQIAGGYKRG